MAKHVEPEESMPENYKPVLYKNTVISEGPPSVWQLAPQKKRSGNVITVKAVGLSEESSKNVRTVLLLGETGSGKSTLINALFNSAIGVKWEENIWFEIMDEDSEDQTESQTSEVTVYEINADHLDFSLCVIDTPGLGDTRGSDEPLTQRLLDLFQSEDGVREVHAVGLVLKASENRLTDRMAYVLNSVTSLFGKDMEQKIVPLFTHSDGRKPTNALQALNSAKVKFARDEKNEPVCFMFDNCQRDDRTNNREYLKLAYESTSKNIQNFMKFLQQQESKHLKETVEVLKERISLRQSIEKLKDQVQKVKEKEKEIHLAKEALDKYEMKMESTKNMNIDTIEMHIEKELVEAGWNLSLQSKDFICCIKCEVTCSASGSKQELFKNSCCSVCPGKCPVQDHQRGHWKYVEKPRKTTITNEFMSEMHEKYKTKRENKIEDSSELKKELSILNNYTCKGLNEVFEIIKKLEHIALNVDSLSTYVHLEFLIENMKERQVQNIQTLETMRDRVDQVVKAGSKYLKKGKNMKSAPQTEQKTPNICDASAADLSTDHTCDHREVRNSGGESRVSQV